MRSLREKRTAYMLIAPTIILVVLVILYPLVYSIITSLTNSVFTKMDSASFVGFKNYWQLLHDNLFLKSVRVTLYFVIVSVFFELVIGMMIAMLLNIKLKGTSFVKALLVVPWALPGTVIAGIWRFIFQSDFGFVNGFLRLLGFETNILWLGSSPLAISVVIFTEVWRSAPFFGIILLAGLSTIPGELYEAARLDGGNEWQIFWRITVPLLKPIIGIILIIRTIFLFQSIELVYVLTQGGPGTDTFFIPFYLYRESFVNMRIGKGSAMAYYLALLIAIFCVIYVISLTRKSRIRE